MTRMLTNIVFLAQTRKLSTADASYLDLAIRLGLPIATQDAALPKSAMVCLVAEFDPIGTQKP